jgi:hypothetical protein
MKHLILILVITNLNFVTVNYLNNNNHFCTQTLVKQTEPVVCFCGNMADGTLSASDAENGLAIACRTAGETFPVHSFNLLVTNGGLTKEAASTSSNLTAEQKKLIIKLKSGSKIVFNQVKIKMPDGTLKEVAPGTFTVK